MIFDYNETAYEVQIVATSFSTPEDSSNCNAALITEQTEIELEQVSKTSKEESSSLSAQNFVPFSGTGYRLTDT